MNQNNIGLMLKYQIEVSPKRNVIDSLAIQHMEREKMFQNHCLFDLSSHLYFLLPGAKSNFPKHKIVTCRPCSTTEQSLILLFRRHSEDSNSA